MLVSFMTTSQGDTISYRQCRAARVWLGLTQRGMAAQVGIDVHTIMQFELGRGTPRRATLLAMRLFFREAGIQFDDQRNLILPE